MIEIINKEDCTGCFACYNVCPQHCIDMVNDNEGFKYPKVNMQLCNNCGLCEKVCPILNNFRVENNPIAYACYNYDEKIRLASSSGGVFTLVAEQVLKNEGVVFGAGFDEEFLVTHDIVETKENLGNIRGSKYVQSEIGDTYKQAKDSVKQGRQVLFTGTPCQISGLKSYLGHDYDNLFSMDIICHGVPSPKVWEKYILFREKIAGVPARRIAFRRKDEGWKRYSVSFLFKNDTEYRKSFDRDLYMQAFLKNFCLRPSCYNCKFKGLNRQSDITLADFWGIQNILPEMDDDKGTSLIFINSKAGKVMFEGIKERMVYQEVDIHRAVKYNSSAIKSVQFNSKRDAFMSEKDNLSFDKLVGKYCTDPLSTRIRSGIKRVLAKTRMLDIVRSFVGNGE